MRRKREQIGLSLSANWHYCRVLFQSTGPKKATPNSPSRLGRLALSAGDIDPYEKGVKSSVVGFVGCKAHLLLTSSLEILNTPILNGKKHSSLVEPHSTLRTRR
jgi:hypothetical protein